MPKSLNDTIREEFKKKLKQPKFIKLIEESELTEKFLINSIESLVPDQDWKKQTISQKRTAISATSEDA